MVPAQCAIHSRQERRKLCDRLRAISILLTNSVKLHKTQVLLEAPSRLRKQKTAAIRVLLAVAQQLDRALWRLALPLLYAQLQI